MAAAKNVSRPSKKNSKQSANASRTAPLTTLFTTQRKRSWYLVLMPLFVLVFGLFYFEKGEVIALNSGCGWDGVTYKNVVWSLQWNKSSAELQERGRLRIDPYRAQRIAPSVAVYGEMQVAKYLYQSIVPMFERLPAWLEWSYQQYPIPLWFFRWFAKDVGSAQQSVALNIDSFVAGYFVFHNLFMLLGTAVFWALIARALTLNAVARWLGFTALFVNVAVMKMSFYYPTLTDTSALFLGAAMLYGYLARQQWILPIVAAIGFFTFPTAFFIAMILFILPRDAEKQAIASSEGTSFDNTSLEVVSFTQATARKIAAGASVLVLLLSVYFVLIAEVRFPEVEPLYMMLLPLTIPLLLVQFFFMVEKILLAFPTAAIMRLLSSRKELVGYALRAFTCLVLWSGLTVWKQQIQDSSLAAPMNTDLFLGGSFSAALSKPLLTIVALSVYFGPMMLIGVMRFREVLQTARELGLGFFAVMTLFALLLTIMTETRQLMNFLPFAVVVIALMMDKMALKPWAVALISLTSVVCSKIWLTMNFTGMQEQAANIQNGSFSAFPLQWYFMNHGPWMSMTAFLLQGVIALCCCGMFWWLFSKEDSATISPNK